jgi:hypothetical protein
MSIFILNKGVYYPQFTYVKAITQDIHQIHQNYYELTDKILINNTYLHSK